MEASQQDKSFPIPSSSATRWSIVLELQKGSEGSRNQALEQLCQHYWLPVYSFIRRKGYGHTDAQDHTQSFFASMLSREAFHLADKERGRFRSFLFSCLQNHLTQDWRNKQALRRNPGENLLSLDFDEGRKYYEAESDDSLLTPDQAWDRKWIQSVIQRVMEHLQEEFQVAGKLPLFQALKPFLTTDKGDVPYQEVADQLGMGVNSIRSAIFRFRQKYARAFRNEIAQTVANESEIDDEIRALLGSLGS